MSDIFETGEPEPPEARFYALASTEAEGDEAIFACSILKGFGWSEEAIIRRFSTVQDLKQFVDTYMYGEVAELPPPKDS